MEEAERALEQFQRLEANVVALRARERELAERVEMQQHQRTLNQVSSGVHVPAPFARARMLRVFCRCAPAVGACERVRAAHVNAVLQVVASVGA